MDPSSVHDNELYDLFFIKKFGTFLTKEWEIDMYKEFNIIRDGDHCGLSFIVFRILRILWQTKRIKKIYRDFDNDKYSDVDVNLIEKYICYRLWGHKKIERLNYFKYIENYKVELELLNNV